MITKFYEDIEIGQQHRTASGRMPSLTRAILPRSLAGAARGEKTIMCAMPEMPVM